MDATNTWLMVDKLIIDEMKEWIFNTWIIGLWYMYV